MGGGSLQLLLFYIFSHSLSRILLREGEDCYPMLSVGKKIKIKNKKTSVEGKREMRTALFPRSLHIHVNQILRDIWGGSTLTT